MRGAEDGLSADDLLGLRHDLRGRAKADGAVGQLTVGDTMTVRTADGVKHRYRVVARELISKGRLPVTELFAVDGPPRLTIISCGGYYDEANGGYQDNVVVTAVPAKAT